MKNDILESKWKEFRSKIDTWREKHNGEQLNKDGTESEEFAGILQKRYGYTQEKALSEMEKHYSKIKL